MTEGSDDPLRDRARAAILARRAKYVALALTSVGLAACSSSQVCLDIVIPPDAAGDGGDAADADDTTPQVCLSPALDAGDASDASGDPDADATPQPCLTPAMDGGAG